MVTGPGETRAYRPRSVFGGVVEEHRREELERNPESEEVFLAEEQLHPSLDEIFVQIDAAHKRGDEWLRHFHPAHGRNGAR